MRPISRSDYASVITGGMAQALLVRGKNLLLKVGCDHADEMISALHDTWNGIVRAIDVPFVDEETEQQVEDQFWEKIESKLREFKAELCSPSPDSETLAALANDDTLNVA